MVLVPLDSGERAESTLGKEHINGPDVGVSSSLIEDGVSVEK